MILNVNIDHVATLRNARGELEPDVVEAALISEKAGAKGIVCHLREDRRHIRDDDVYNLKNSIKTRLDLEMANNPEIIKIAVDVKPSLVTIVPEKREELTTEGGLNLAIGQESLRNLCNTMQANNIITSFFIEPDKKQIDLARELGAEMIEIHTGKYANLLDIEAISEELKKIYEAAKYAKEIGLKVAAGHGLNLLNTDKIASIQYIDELSIGHSIISNSIYLGLESTVKKFLSIIEENSK